MKALRTPGRPTETATSGAAGESAPSIPSHPGNTASATAPITPPPRCETSRMLRLRGMTSGSFSAMAPRGGAGGTSCAAPLWAGFIALVNQQAAAWRQPDGGSDQLGRLCPRPKELPYSSSFHDITTGNNTNAQSTNLYEAVSGYDLCTGWGTPNGVGLINALSPEPFVITPSAGFVSSGPYGGPFSVTNLNFTLSNIAPASLTWSLANTSSWLSASSSGGTLSGSAIVRCFPQFHCDESFCGQL